MKKGRETKKETVADIIKENYFEYAIVPKIEREILGEYRAKLTCISSFIFSYQKSQKKQINKLIMDGILEDTFDNDLYKTLEVLSNGLFKKKNPNKIMPKNILVEPKADTIYPIVNQADRIAYSLKQYHEIKGHKKDKYLEHKLSPDWSGYKKIFDYVGIVNK